MKRVEGKVAMVTGASLGLGRATAMLLAREGARIVATDVKQAEGRSLVDEIVDAGGEAVFVRHDVASEADWENAIETALGRFGRLDILVNNAGVLGAGDVEGATLEQWRALMAVNLDGVFLGVKHAIAAMRKGGGGSIVNLSSIAGIIGYPTLAAYCASKGGVRLFTKSAALHCAQAGYNIRVNSIHPGAIMTPMLQELFDAAPDPKAARAQMEAAHPIGRIGEPDDIAYGVLYLASDESKFVTGAELAIDGGYIAQ